MCPLASLLSNMSCFPGSEDGRVHVWSTESGMKVAVLDGKHPGPINTLQFNPRYMTFASACTHMVSSKSLHQFYRNTLVSFVISSCLPVTEILAPMS